jgi:hypothetical protein
MHKYNSSACILWWGGGGGRKRHIQNRSHQTRLGPPGSQEASSANLEQDRPESACFFVIYLFPPCFIRWAQEEWKSISRQEGEGAVEKKRGWAGKERQGRGRVPRVPAGLTWGARGRPGQQQQPEAGEQQPGAVTAAAGMAGGRPAAARPRDQRDPGAGFPLHGRASRRRRAPGSPGPRPGPASRLGALRPGSCGRCGCGWDRAPRTGTGGGRRSEARRGEARRGEARRGEASGGGPGAGTADRGGQPHAAAPLRPLRSLGASEPPAGSARARRGEASTTSRPARRLPAGRPRRRGRCPALLQNPPPGRGAGDAGDAGGLGRARWFREEGSEPGRRATPESSGAGSRCVRSACARGAALGAAERTKPESPACSEREGERARLCPASLPSATLGWWVLGKPPGSTTSHLVGLQKSSPEPN